jgi:hypothetical protein
MVNRQRLLWTIATRRQLERWEPVKAAIVLDFLRGRQPDGPDIWSAEIEKHLALVAAVNLLRALDLSPPTAVSIEPILRAELKEGRDLVEHWPDNMPVFNVSPRVQQPPRSSGKSFAARNPRRRPYGQIDYRPETGVWLLPNVSAQALHRLLDDVEAEVLSKNDSLRRFIPPRAPSPWLREGSRWLPKGYTADVG